MTVRIRKLHMKCWISFFEDENIQTYLDDQKAVPCKEGDFTLPSTLDGMKEYIEEGRMADYQDHYYPTEMAVDCTDPDLPDEKG